MGIKILFLLLFLITLSPVFAQEEPENIRTNPPSDGNYFGQKPPGIIPKVFAPRILSKSKPQWAFSTAFHPDGKEFYFASTNVQKNIDEILFMKFENGHWSEPEVTSFSGKFNNHDVFLAQNGNKIFFRSKRYIKNSTTLTKYHQLWFSTRTENEWGPAEPVLDNENNRIEAGYPSVSKTGTLYYSYYDEKNGQPDIHKSELVNGVYSKPVSLGSMINTKYGEGDVFVAPDESYLIVSVWRHPQNRGSSDLYISFRKDNQWTKLTNMGDTVNTENNEGCPYISPDGKYFFYFVVEEKDIPVGKTYWVDAKIIEQFRPK
mgnify:CR=1 FL=1